MKYTFLILDKNKLIKSAIAYARYPIAGERVQEARDERGAGLIRLPDIPTFICFMIGAARLHCSSYRALMNVDFPYFHFFFVLS